MAPGRRAVVLVAAMAIAVTIAALWLAPAALLDPRLARATGGILHLANADGTVRQGRGDLVAGTTRIPIAWRVEFWPLLQGVVRTRLMSATGAGTPRAAMAVGLDTLAFHDVDVTFPAAVVAAVLRQGDGVFVAGEINITAADIELTEGSSRGEARLAWHAARITFPGSAVPVDLGDVRTVVTAGGSAFSGPLGNDGGDLALRGEWAMHAHDSARVSLHVAPRRPGMSDLERTLSAIGTADGDGWRIEWHASLR